MRKISHIFSLPKPARAARVWPQVPGTIPCQPPFCRGGPRGLPLVCGGGASRRPRPTGVTAQGRAAIWGRPYKNTKACPVNAVGAGHWPARRGASAIPEPPSSASLRSAPSPRGRLAGDRKGRPYGGKRTGSVGSAEPGAEVEPHRPQFSTYPGPSGPAGI